MGSLTARRFLLGTLALLAAATAPVAQTERELLSELVTAYRNACEADNRAERARFDEPVDPTPFELSEDAVYRIRVTEDLDALVFHAEFRCGYFGWGYNCGSGGCTGHLIVDGTVYDYWGRRPFSVETGPGQYQVLFGTHGSNCRDATDPDAYTAPGAAPCYVAATWFDGRFVSRVPILGRREAETR
jgi:hypothetical protein